MGRRRRWATSCWPRRSPTASPRPPRRAGADALVLPAIPFGGVDFFSFVPGGVVLSPATLQAVVEETCDNLVRTGTRRILILNGHAGSIAPVDAAARALRRRHDLLVPAHASLAHRRRRCMPSSAAARQASAMAAIPSGRWRCSAARSLPAGGGAEKRRCRRSSACRWPISARSRRRRRDRGAHGGRGGRPRRRCLRRQPPWQCRARRPHRRAAGRGRRRHAGATEGPVS